MDTPNRVEHIRSLAPKLNAALLEGMPTVVDEDADTFHEHFRQILEDGENQEVLEAIGIHVRSEQDCVNRFQTGLHLPGLLACERLAAVQPDSTIEEDKEKLRGGMITGIRVLDYISLPAYLCAEHQFQSRDDFVRIAEESTFGDVADWISHPDQLRIDYELTKTAQFQFSVDTFGMKRESVIWIGDIHGKPHFLQAYRDLHGEVPKFSIFELCEKTAEGHVVLSHPVRDFLRAMIQTVNYVHQREEAWGIPEQDRIEKAGSIGCPISLERGKLDPGQYSPGEWALIRSTLHVRGDQKQYSTPHPGALRTMHELLANRYRLLDDGRPIARHVSEWFALT